MVLTRLSALVLALLLAASVPIPAAEAAPFADPVIEPPDVHRPDAPVRLAVANLREGSLLRHGADLRAGQDRAAFARRLLGRPGPPPDVVLLQEVLGTAGRVAEALNAVQRGRERAARFRVVTTTSRRVDGGRCDGPRRGRFSVLRSSAVLVNAATVTGVVARGTLRTWGRWSTDLRSVIGRGGHGCTEHPWVRLSVATPDGPRTATLVDVHVAPSGTALKARAVGTLRRRLQDLVEQTPTDLTVLAGDFNLPRCGIASEVPPPGCRVRDVHRALLDAGFRDAVATANPSGPAAVSGVARRIDFVYTRGAVARGWWDRCYQAFHVARPRCGSRAAFASQADFVDCQERALYQGSAGGRCRQPEFGRYYSDHPILTAALR